MAVDYLSALNVGSGLNVTQIVDALVDAEKAPKEATLNSKVEEKTVSISSFAEVKQEFNTFNENLSLLSNFTGLIVQSSGSKITPKVTDKSKVAVGENVVSVSQLAASQTLAFTGYTSETASVDASSITIDLGEWNDDGSFTQSNLTGNLNFDGNETLADVRDAINELDLGITSSIIRTSDNNYALTVRAPLGAKNQMRIQAESTDSVPYSKLNFNPADNSDDLNKQAVRGTDANLSINGISIIRPNNKIDDAIAGISIELNDVTNGQTETISSSYSEEMTREAVQLFVDELNTTITQLADMNKTGMDDDTSGPLAGDTLIRSFRNQLRLITTTPITGFGDEDIFLSSFGVMTNRDGTLSVDDSKFKSFFDSNPGGFAALANSQVSTNSLSVKAEMTSNSYRPGIYQFVKESDGTATLYDYIENPDGTKTLGDGVLMSLENGIYKTTEGGGRGIHIVADGTTADTKIYIGKSLFESLQTFTQSVLKVNSDIDQKVTRYSNDIEEYKEELETLNEKMEAQRALYLERFTAMETAVSSFKETSTLLDNFMESWRAGLKN